MNRSIRMIGLDLDGTALNSKKQMTPAVRSAIARAIKAGITVLPATGRSLSGLPGEFLDIPGVRYALCANGAEVYDLSNGSIVHSDYFDTPTALSIVEDCHRLRSFPAVMAGGGVYAEWTDFDQLAGQLPPATVTYLKASRQPVDSLEAFIRDSRQPVAKVILIFPELSIRPRAITHFTQRGDCTVTASLETNLEINTTTANKGAGLLALAGQLGIAREEVMAVGDGLNDLAMLRAVGYAVAMAGSIPQVLAAADDVTASCDKDGVALAIDRVLGQ